MQPAFKILFVPLLVSIGGLVAGAANGQRLLAAAAAALGAAFLTLSALLLDASLADGDGLVPAVERKAARANAGLLAVGWGWAGVSMLAVYLLSGLRWQHGWQYGSGMLLVAALIAIYAGSLRHPESPLASPQALAGARWASILQAIAATAALVWLALSGKLATVKDDWAANDIFLAGGAAIVALGVISLFGKAHRARGRSHAGGGGTAAS